MISDYLRLVGNISIMIIYNETEALDRGRIVWKCNLAVSPDYTKIASLASSQLERRLIKYFLILSNCSIGPSDVKLLSVIIN